MGHPRHPDFLVSHLNYLVIIPLIGPGLMDLCGYIFAIKTKFNFGVEICVMKTIYTTVLSLCGHHYLYFYDNCLVGFLLHKGTFLNILQSISALVLLASLYIHTCQLQNHSSPS